MFAPATLPTKDIRQHGRTFLNLLFRPDVVQRGKIPQPDCVLLNESVLLKFIPDGFVRYFNTYGRLTRRCKSRSAAVVRHNSGKHYCFYFRHNEFSKKRYLT